LSSFSVSDPASWSTVARTNEQNKIIALYFTVMNEEAGQSRQN
jgi:hypothetical protein